MQERFRCNHNQEQTTPTETAGLSVKPTFCVKCVMSDQRPRIVFDAEGVCMACRYAEYRSTVDWTSREGALFNLLDLHRSRDAAFDCIVPSSGGKDSVVVAHQLKFKYGMHPLTVTWAPHIYTEIGRKNFQGLVDAGLDNILVTPNGQVHRRLTRQALIDLGDPFMPFKYGQVIAPVREALQRGIKLIFSGENGEATYTGNPEVWDNPGFKPEDYAKQWFSGVPVESWLEKGFSRADLALYLAPAQDSIAAAGIERYFWSYFRPWHPQSNFYYAREHTGFEPNPEGRSEGTYSKYASLDDKIDGFYYWFGYLKFGIGRATSDAAHEVRDGEIAREEAVALVHKYDGEFPRKHFAAFMEYTGIEEGWFWRLAHHWRNPELVGDQFQALLRVS